nr:DUF262 domain-containing protein [uncultured Carboxylicivirga sp.]
MLYLKSIQQLTKHHFRVDKYQRGYKWDVRQVLDILEDIESFEPLGKRFYCLQPVVVRSIENKNINEYELIDGQQRLTTIFIILSALKTELYSIDYQTRTESAQFLSSISSLIERKEIDVALDSEILEKKLDELWENYISQNSTYDNIDNYHFFKAYQIISNWLAIREQTEIDVFKRKLVSNTKLIWYLIEDQTESSEQVFININSGKIPLTNAELIKALFLVNNDFHNNPSAFSLKQNEIALDWDRIEYSLQNDEFWYFLTEEDSSQNPTRIELLFDIIQNKPSKSKDPFYSYRKYAQQTKLDWEEVKNLFLLLQEWFEDRFLYHLIGYVVSRKIANIFHIIQIHKNSNTKQDFEEKIKDLIKVRFRKKDKESDTYIYDIDLLHYERNPGAVIDVLLLHNIMTYLTSDNNYRFPFNHFKKQKDWSIEHIHAQNSKPLNKPEELSAWVFQNSSLLKELQADDREEKINELLLELEKLHVEYGLKEVPKQTKELYVSTQQKVFEFFGDIKDEDQKHGIGNLALLDKNTNSALNNSTFSIKRQKMLTIDKEGGILRNGKKMKAFIPICTKNTFLKYYSKDISQMHFWTEKDREDYQKNISQLLIDYLPVN